MQLGKYIFKEKGLERWFIENIRNDNVSSTSPYNKHNEDIGINIKVVVFGLYHTSFAACFCCANII